MASVVTYRVTPAVPRSHLFDVEILIPSSDREPRLLSMPAWIPGSYMIRDFARNVIRLDAETVSGTPVPTSKLDKQTWAFAASGEALTIRYRVFAWELSVRAAHLDHTHAYFNGASLLMRVQGLDKQGCRIELARPCTPVDGRWRVATSLLPRQVDSDGFGLYEADDYEDLIDHPVEIGCFADIPFEVHGIPHRVVISGRHRLDAQRLARDLARVCADQAALFGELPVDRYLFLVRVTGDGYGGLEHRYSTSLMCARSDLPRPNDDACSPSYIRFLGLCSHEYFHLWNVKRIRPQALREGGLDREVHTRTLWAFEGITSYYDDLALVRSGVIDSKAYLGRVAETITRLMRTPGREVQTLAESSFDAWTKFYKQDENAPNATVSYYVKGALVALALDLTIRIGTGGRRSLDDLMRTLWARYGRSGLGVPERGIESLASEVSGLDLADFFRSALDGTEDLDLHSLLDGVGIAMRLRPSRGAKDVGGCVDRFETSAAVPTLDVRLRPGGGDAVVQNVLRDGAGERAGIAPGDVLVAIDGLRVTAENLDRLVADASCAAGVPVHLFRRDELMRVVAHPLPAGSDTCDLMICETASDAAIERRHAWLSGSG